MPTTAVGLDIGRTAVRAVELRGGTKRPVVRRAGRVPLPLGAVEGGLIKDPAAVTEALRTLWKEAKISSKEVRLGVCSGSVLVRQIELDWMPPGDLRRALRYQVADLLPVSVDDANLDHVHLGEHEGIDPETGATRRMVRILLVATARGGVDEMVRCVQAAGLRPVSADLSPLALVRAAARSGSEPDLTVDPLASLDGLSELASPLTGAITEAVIDVGADKISVAVHSDGVPRFVRVAPGLGGEAFTRAVVERTGVSWAEAEESKTGDGSSLDPQARDALASAAEQLLGDIRTTLDYHAGADPDHVPSRAVLVGGGAAHADFAELCTRHLGIPVRRIDAGSVARVRPDALDPAGSDDLLVPIGLCLGASA